ncbi:UDP-N-acetylmuramoyl-tripeptide--D-alanyl-D-alanine ligase [Paenibacillus taiwanensis]|uniref:UDP-N-acetylmuramoyl-tripeptide--D-alanyl-D- alanine ligase n=1 Tax=Paenibacillus taiwanensis TaxID=401638 RepID=UPI0003FB90DD|nr:UDP-N-acetylmuramoyl-tripeptide--D-alanyl-D-alanine ligase [Paenibacillus taiwanensis]
MIETNLTSIAAMCGGTLLDAAQEQIAVRGVFTDSRQVEQGALFVPLAGDRFDGHSYVEQALAAGAAAAFWQADHPLPEARLPLVIVDDTLLALQRMATHYIKQLDVKVIAVTGSNGKTTTKDLITAVLSRSYRVHKTEGNFNNHIGLPLTVLRMPADTDVVVLEMGMSGRGEIELLTKLVHPDIAVITNIGEAHLLQLGSRTEIARAKLEIISGLKEEGVLICLGDEPLLEQVIGEPETTQPASMNVVTYGMGPLNDYRPDSIMQMEDGMTFSVITALGERSVYSIPILGQHNVLNAMAAIAIGRLLHVPEQMIGAALESVQISGMRIEKIDTEQGWTILNDAYNASPTAMKAAIDVLASVRGGKRIAILGDMLELGEQEVQLHREVGAYITSHKTDVLLTYGKLGNEIAEGAKSHLPEGAVRSFQNKDELRNYMLELVEPHATVLVKASRGMKMEEIIKQWIQIKH